MQSKKKSIQILSGKRIGQKVSSKFQQKTLKFVQKACQDIGQIHHITRSGFLNIKKINGRILSSSKQRNLEITPPNGYFYNNDHKDVGLVTMSTLFSAEQ